MQPGAHDGRCAKEAAIRAASAAWSQAASAKDLDKAVSFYAERIRDGFRDAGESINSVGKGTTSITTTHTIAVGTPTNVKRLLRNSATPALLILRLALVLGPASRVRA